jgi:uncharacterized protein (DUF1697 family)
MAGLREYAEKLGLKNVRSYINSGNLIVETDRKDIQQLVIAVEKDIQEKFGVTIRIVAIEANAYKQIVANTPAGWGQKPDWKYNTLFLIPPYDIDAIIKDIGELKPDIETLDVGAGVLYHSVHFPSFGRSTTGKLAARASYKQMTVRNWNTTKKLAELLDQS